MRRHDSLLDGLHQELRDLGRTQLIPRQGGLAAGGNEGAYGMGDIVYGEGIWTENV